MERKRKEGAGKVKEEEEEDKAAPWHIAQLLRAADDKVRVCYAWGRSKPATHC